MTGNIQVATTVLGGLALFIYGMGLMSEGLTQVAGARMKAILGYVTKNRVAAIAAGASFEPCPPKNRHARYDEF